MTTATSASVAEYYRTYTVVLVVVLVGIALVVVAFGVSRLLRPVRSRVAASGPAGVGSVVERLVAYESGVDPVGGGWAQQSVRYYVFAYLYIVFAVDAMYLFPWATVFAAPGFGVTTLVEMGVFVGLLVIGLAYAWGTGVLRWT